MDRLKRLKTALFVDGGLFFSVMLLTAVVFSWTVFVDWGGPVDDLKPEERAKLEDCIRARREVGDRIDRERPDCKDVLLSPLAATVSAP